jgi:hypothetical protein
LLFSEFGCVELDTILGILGVILDLYFFTWYFGYFRTLSFFSVSPLGLLGFFGLVIFRGIW